MKIINTVILDIEGTTTPISFVHDVLFPYIRENLRGYLVDNWTQTGVQEDVMTLYQWSQTDDVSPKIIDVTANDKDLVIDSLEKNILSQMDADRKTLPLKQLQGHMWAHAYEAGTVQGVVFDDVVPALNRWQQERADVYIYSSGSVAAQRLLFGYSVAGDLLPLLKGHFDTTIGSKLEASSYSKIVETIQPSAAPAALDTFLFVTDSQKEAIAACQAGINVCLSVRPGNPALDTSLATNHIDQITSFDQLFEKYKFSN
eukprot:gene8175-9610_t